MGDSHPGPRDVVAPRGILGFLVPSAVALSGVALQMLQTEDPRNPFAYFTVDSALLVAATPCVAALKARGVRDVWAAGAAGALVSGAVYWLAIAPFNGVGTRPATIAANLVLHAALPLACVWAASLRSGPVSERPVAVSLWWPALYIAAVMVASQTTKWEPPYAFLNSNDVGTPGVVASCAVVAVLYVGAGRLLRGMRRRAKFGG